MKHIMKLSVLVFFTLVNIACYSQTTLNAYKYVLVPEKYDFLRENNQYMLNSTTKQLLEQKGFTVFLGDEPLPALVATNNCYALKVEVSQRKGFLSTNLTVQLKDCQGNIVFKSKEGKSREKEFDMAYDEALRDAFSSLNSVPYTYDSTILMQRLQPAAAGPVGNMAPASGTGMIAPAPAAPAASVPAQTPASAPVPPAAPTSAELTGTLYAQPILNGYQLVDTSPKKILSLLKTSIPDHYIAQAGAFNGIVFKKDGAWYFDHYEDNKLVSQKLDIKF